MCVCVCVCVYRGGSVCECVCTVFSHGRTGTHWTALHLCRKENTHTHTYLVLAVRQVCVCVCMCVCVCVCMCVCVCVCVCFCFSHKAPPSRFLFYTSAFRGTRAEEKTCELPR